LVHRHLDCRSHRSAWTCWSGRRRPAPSRDVSDVHIYIYIYIYIVDVHMAPICPHKPGTAATSFLPSQQFFSSLGVDSARQQAWADSSGTKTCDITPNQNKEYSASAPPPRPCAALLVVGAVVMRINCGRVSFRNRVAKQGAKARCILDTKAKLEHASSPEPLRYPKVQ